MTVFSPNSNQDPQKPPNPSKFLQSHQIEMIDEALSSVGDFGEVRLIVEKGRLRFLVTQKSFDTLKWSPGSLNGED
jgi:hypothetical protein